MRFSADKHDWILIGIMSIPILYISALFVANVACLYNEGRFYGVIPLLAFYPQYILTTLVLALVMLIAGFFTINSSKIERESGFGIAFKKKDKGYARWATSREYKKELTKVDIKADTLPTAGVPMISDGKHMWVDAGEDHYLIVGATGSGKTVIVAKPTIKLLAKASESIIVTDPKGELYEATANMLKEKGYNIVLLNFRDPQ